MCPTQAIEIFGNLYSTPFGILAISDLLVKIFSEIVPGNPSVGGGGFNQRVVAKYSDFGLFQGYISETVQDRRYSVN